MTTLLLSAVDTASVFNMLGFLCQLEDRGDVANYTTIVGVGLASIVATMLSLKWSVRRIVIELLGYKFNYYSLERDPMSMSKIFTSVIIKNLERFVDNSLTLSNLFIDNGINLSLPHYTNRCELIDAINTPSVRILDALHVAIDRDTHFCNFDSYPYQLCPNGVGIYVESEDKRSLCNFIKTVDSYQNGVHYHLDHPIATGGVLKISLDSGAKLLVDGYHREIKEAKKNLSLYS